MSCTTLEKDPKKSSFQSKESQTCQENIIKTPRKEKQLTRAEKLEMFLGYFDVPKYWLWVIYRHL